MFMPRLELATKSRKHENDACLFRVFVFSLLVSSLCVGFSGCAHPKRAAQPPDLYTPRLEAADAQLRAGCLECLIGAFREYDRLRSIPAAADRASAGAVRAAVLIALRQRELGMVDEGYLDRARSIVVGQVTVPNLLSRVIDIVDALPPASVGAGRPTSDADLEKMRIVRDHRETWTSLLRGSAAFDEAAAYTWLALMCGSSEARNVGREDLLSAAAVFADAPLIRYREASCRAFEADVLESLLAAEPKFTEIAYSLGTREVARRKLHDADKWFERAYAWHPAWPTLTLAMANVAMTAEEFERALAMYEATLRHEPGAVDALLGRIRSLTYLARHEEAIATTDVLLGERWYVGDARYWRALNEAELERYDEAWVDVELAAKLLINAEVPKLAGIIAYRRHQLDVARGKFEESRRRNANDCETGFYLGVVLAELAVWDRTSEVLVDTAQCLTRAEQAAREEIEKIRASDDPPERQARQIARRERQIANSRRMMAQSWFNTAVAYYNLSRTAEAREYAEKVADDEQFGERAREILSRLR